MTSGNKIVDTISEMRINSIPESWYETIRHNDQPYALAILILWDFVYWYKWTEIKDEETGLIVAYKKKFKADFLQRSYKQISEKFKISQKVAMKAIKFLSDLGVIKKHLRTISINGLKCPNVMYIELVPEVLKQLSNPTLTKEQVKNSTKTEQEEIKFPPCKDVLFPTANDSQSDMTTHNQKETTPTVQSDNICTSQIGRTNTINTHTTNSNTISSDTNSILEFKNLNSLSRSENLNNINSLSKNINYQDLNSLSQNLNSLVQELNLVLKNLNSSSENLNSPTELSFQDLELVSEDEFINKNFSEKNEKSVNKKSEKKKTKYSAFQYDTCIDLVLAQQKELAKKYKNIYSQPVSKKVWYITLKRKFDEFGVEKTLEGIKNSVNFDWLVNTAHYSFNALFSNKIFPQCVNKSFVNYSSKKGDAVSDNVPTPSEYENSVKNWRSSVC